MLRPELVEGRRVRQGDGVAGALGGQSPAVEDDQRDRTGGKRAGAVGPVHAIAASTMRANLTGSRLAPPTRAPSMSGRARSSRAFSSFTLPPYWIRTRSAR